MNALETYVAIAVTLLFVAGVAWLVVALRESKRMRRRWQWRA